MLALFEPMQADTELSTSSRPLDLHSTAWLVLLLLAVVFFASIRYRLRDMPLERDEGEYAYAGQLLLQGIPPYVLAYNMKLPGIYAAYAGVMALFGETPAGIHVGLLLVNAATTILLFFLTAPLFGRLAAAVTGLSYALLSTSASVMGFEAHATHFVVFPALLSIWLLLRALHSRRWWLFFLSGLLSGIAVLMKQHGIFFVFFCLLYLAWVQSKHESKREPPRIVLRWSAIFGAGVILPYLATCLWMYRAGVFSQFWFWTVDYAGEYSKMGLRRALHAFLDNSQIVVSPSPPIWILAAIGLTAVIWSPSARRQSRFLIALLLCSFLALCPGAYFRPHYYILLLPVISIFVGVAASSVTEKLRQSGKPAYMAALPLLVFLACFGVSVLHQRQVYFSLQPDAVVQSIYGDNAFVPATKIADYIRENSPTDARIAVLGSEPEIYFYARRHSATGYVYMYSLIVHHKFTARMRDEMMRELEENRPLYVVYVDVWDDWGGLEGDPQLASFLLRLHQFMDQSYEVVGLADVGQQTQYHWDAEAKDYRPLSSKVIYLLRRKPGS
jgi:4-amino-4-deoxy-L-arabinose transferase-like glycosyltransferase